MQTLRGSARNHDGDMHGMSAIELASSHVVLGHGLGRHISEVETADDRDAVHDIAREIYSRNAAGEDCRGCGYARDELHGRVSWLRLRRYNCHVRLTSSAL